MADVIVIIGAGPGIGASVASRFAREGHAVGLIARNADRLRRMAAELTDRTGARTATAAADAADPDALGRAVSAITAELGPPTVLCFSPLPDVGLIRPVLETSSAELMSSLQLNVGGAAAAVGAVVPGMLAAGRGSLLFTTGSAGLRPSPDRAASAVTTTAATTYVALVRQALEGTGIRVGHTVIVGPVDAARDDAHDPDTVAADLWSHHDDPTHPSPSVLGL